MFIVTGVARIGKAVAQGLAGRGAKLTITCRHHEPDVSPLTTDAVVSFVQADLSQLSDVTRVVAHIKAHYGRLDRSIHMAVTYQRTPWNTVSEQNWDETMNAIANSTFLLSKAVGDHLLTNVSEDAIKRKILTISDWSVLTPPIKTTCRRTSHKWPSSVSRSHWRKSWPLRLRSTACARSDSKAGESVGQGCW